MRRLVYAGLIVVWPFACAGAQTSCPTARTTTARAADVDDRLEIALEDGGHLRLYGVEAPAPPAGADAAVKLRAWLTDRDLDIDYIGATQDRWGRNLARVFATLPDDDERAPVSLADHLIATGAARALVEPGPAACLAPLFTLEEEARLGHRGLWADPANAPLPSSQREALAGHAGQKVIVEGRVTSVGETASRLYLNFGPMRTVDFSATIPRATLKQMTASGLDPRTLTGAFARIRGQLDLRFGPQIEIIYPSALEIPASAVNSPYNRPRARQ